MGEDPHGEYCAQTDRLYGVGDVGEPTVWSLNCATDMAVWNLGNWCHLYRERFTVSDTKLYFIDSDWLNLCIADAACRRTTANLVWPYLDGWPVSFCVSRSSGKVYVVSDGYQLATLDGAGDTFLKVFVPTPPVPVGLAASAESVGVLVCAVDGHPEIRLLDCTTDEFTQTIALPSPAEALTTDPDGVTVYAVCFTTLISLDARAGMLTNSIELPSPVGEVCIPPSRDKLYAVGRWERGIHVVSRDLDSLLGWIPTPTAVTSMRHDADGSRLFFACSADTRVGVVDCARDTVVRWIEAGLHGNHASLVYWPHGDRLYATSRDSVRVTECSGTKARTLERGFHDPTISPPLPALNMLCVWEHEGFIALVEDRMPARPGVARVRAKATPTVSKGALYVSRRGPAYLYDRTGRLAAMLGPGDNDVSGLRSGVYFLRRTRDALATKVIITN